jgi:FtsZ-interacting cell division protein YlmF
MSQTEFSLILQHLARLEEVLLDSSEMPLSGRDIGNNNEALHLIESIRSYIQVSDDKNQKELFVDRVSSNGRVNTTQSMDGTGSALHTTSCWIKHRIEVFASKFKSDAKSRRKRLVKILLSDNELHLLDHAVEEYGLDRTSIFRNLLLNHANPSNASGKLAEETAEGEQISRINISDMGVKPLKPTIQLAEPRDFDEMPNTVKTIRDGTAVILNLTMMEPDQAQRAVDWVAGATFYADGHQERVGESIFLFSPAAFNIVASSEETDKYSKSLIRGDSVEDSEPNRHSLTPIQESCLQIVRDRWEREQLFTTPTQLAAQMNPATESDAYFRLIRRTLFGLCKLGLTEKSLDDDECFDYRPVIKNDPTSAERVGTEDE